MFDNIRTLHVIFIVLAALVSIGVWTSSGYVVAWILGAGLSVVVNVNVFVISGLVIGMLNALFILLIGLIQKNIMKGVD